MNSRLLQWVFNCVSVHENAIKLGDGNHNLNFTTCMQDFKNTFNKYSDYSTKTYLPIFYELQEIHKKCLAKNCVDLCNNAIIYMINEIFKSVKPGDKIRFILLPIIFQMAYINGEMGLIRDIGLIVTANLEKIVLRTRISLMCSIALKKLTYAFPIVKLLLSTLQESESFNIIDIKKNESYLSSDKRKELNDIFPVTTFFSIKNNKFYRTRGRCADKDMKYGEYDCWYIHNLVYRLPAEWRMLVVLSVTKCSYLQSYDKDNLIDYYICDKYITTGFRNKLLHYLANTKDEYMGHKFFNIDEEVKDYIASRTLFTKHIMLSPLNDQ